jgi:sulfoxide reductase heme-binding subunit YedZ
VIVRSVHDLFGFANFTGALGALIIITLLATPNDYSLRALGTPCWKLLQRWNYGAFSLVATHSIAYQVNEKQVVPFVMIVTVCIVATAALQIAGFVNRKATIDSRS